MYISIKDGRRIPTKSGSNIVFDKNEYDISFITHSGVILKLPIKDIVQIEP